MSEDLSSNSDENRLSDDSGEEHIPSEQESGTDSDSGEKTSESNNDSSSSSDFAPAKKKKKRDSNRSERDMVMKVIQNNPDDFGVRRSARPVKKYSEGDSDDASSDDNYAPVQRYTQRAAARAVKEVDYGISSEDSDEEDTKKVTRVEVDGDKIEKVLDSRDGPVGFTGDQTIAYNEDEQKKVYLAEYDGETEKQYLIKWQGWSHLHNTWESEKSIKNQGVLGVRKLENFIRKERESEKWLKYASKEEIEFYHVQNEMERDVFQQHVHAERIITKRTVENEDGFEKTEFMIKWKGLPYSDATWEADNLVEGRFQERLAEYEHRLLHQKFPSANNSFMKRPKFHRYKEQPHFLPESLSLRDYQIDGVNWLMHAWCKGNSCILADEMGLGKTIQTVSFVSALFHDHDRAGPFLCVVPLSTLALRETQLLNSVRWSVLAIDEAHRLKNDEAMLYQALNDLKTEHRLLITGTPLQNSLRELWCLLDFANPDQMGPWAEFEAKHEEDQARGFTGLHKELQPFLFRRVKKDVEKSLPGKIEQILRVGLSKKQKKYYKFILTKNFKELQKGVHGSKSSFTNIMIELKKCSNHAWLVKDPDDLDEFDQKSTEEKIDRILKGSGKMMLLDKLLRRLKENGSRVLIFSQMVMMLDVIGDYMALRRYQFQRLDGSIRGDLRQRSMEHFNATDSEDFAFLLSTRAGGLGINLATADTVIIFDSDWNPQNDLQAQARAHRIGQKKTVKIYRFVSAMSVEEDVIERAKKKMVLDHLVIQRMDTSGRTVLSKKSDASKSIPFDKQEITQILKFGAEELFKEEDDAEPECDIDLILQRAETTETEASGNAQTNELMSGFKVADFQFDEDKLWDDIIPEHERIRQAEEEIAALGERRAKYKSKNTNDDNEDFEADDASEGSNESNSKSHRLPNWRELNLTHTKAFLKSIKKWGYEKKEKVMEENPKFPQNFNYDGAVMELVESLIQCDNQNSKSKGKGQNLKLGEQPVPVKVTLARIRALSALHKLPEPIDVVPLPRKVRPVTNWTCHWVEDDDRQLLKGVKRYGVGEWEKIKADDEFKLAHKILPPSEDASPQSRQLVTRFDYVMSHFVREQEQKSSSSSMSKSQYPTKKRKSVAGRDHSSRRESRMEMDENDPPKSDKKRKSSLQSNGKPEKEKKKSEKAPLLDKDIKLKVLAEELDPAWFDKCKSAMKPHKTARHALKALHSAGNSESRIKKVIGDIGVAIRKISDQQGAERALWKHALWRFVSQFSHATAETLVRCYDSIAHKAPKLPKIVDRTEKGKVQTKDRKDKSSSREEKPKKPKPKDWKERSYLKKPKPDKPPSSSPPKT
ncbi:Oidioi.mRNA.OKI2018_I69.PAR.g12999.t1.cds [Oikopleura dioica]|uniref:Oidioi.mRNA.OKI2018_I69.PAR.g12999.t1.cds n=1 Tax=Oikopleura dioica TaxID=34765 RepID=A0ABN7S9J6_OIKDI|nr:Oidioi.mRNA.OKI2018_I69.PAR.g12999.t1.cds [Oikopleura dioica]